MSALMEVRRQDLTPAEKMVHLVCEECWPKPGGTQVALCGYPTTEDTDILAEADCVVCAERSCPACDS